MANTYTLIASSTVGSGGAGNIEFTSIPSTYTDLVLLCSLRSDRSSINDTMTLRFNGTNITGRRIYGTGSSAASDTVPEMLPPSATATSNTFGSSLVYIPNYASTTQYKSVSIDDTMETNGTSSYMDFIAGLYSSNSAVSSIMLVPNNGNWVQYSSAYLYGISKS